jgi:hypothetical protein
MTLRRVALRQPRCRRESDALRRRLAELVRERQALREEGAAEAVLEENRLEIVQAQLGLAQALVSEYFAASAA